MNVNKELHNEDGLLYQRHLETNERRFHSLIQNGSDLMCIIDMTGKYLYVADNYKNLMGYEATFFLGKNAFDFILPEDRQRTADVLLKLKPKEMVEVPLFRFIAADGTYRWIESKVVDLHDDPAIGGIVVNSRDVTEKKMTQELLQEEIANRQKTITHAIVKAQDKERHEIGLELHDNINQILSTVKLYLTLAQEPGGASKELLPKASDRIEECIQEIRKLSRRLVSPLHHGLPLEEALGNLIDSIALAGTLKCSYEAHNLHSRVVSEEVQISVYRIMQEQLTNILKHSRATTVDVTVACLNDQIELEIIDNGEGFDTKKTYKGMGIANMFNRAESVNGTLSINSQRFSGTVLKASFPVVFYPAQKR